MLRSDGDLAIRQVDLGDVAGDDDLGAKAQPCQEHFHLFAGGILCLIQNDKRLIQRPSAHIGQRGDLNAAAFMQPLEVFRAKKVKQRVVQRAQIRVDLVLQIARQEAQLFTGFNRRTGSE